MARTIQIPGIERRKSRSTGVSALTIHRGRARPPDWESRPPRRGHRAAVGPDVDPGRLRPDARPAL